MDQGSEKFLQKLNEITKIACFSGKTPYVYIL